MLGAVLSYFTWGKHFRIPSSRSLRFGNDSADSNLIARTGNPRAGCAMDRAKEYRAKAFELLSLAETVNEPERRADMLRYARMRMSLSEPMSHLPSAYELPRAKAA